MRISRKGLLGVAVALSLVAGCGGGTAGTSSTGGFEKVFVGTVRDLSGEPVPGAEVRLLGTDASDTTNQFGDFSFGAMAGPSPIALQVETTGAVLEGPLPELAAAASAVRLDLAAGSEQLSIQNIELILEGIDGNGCENAFDPVMRLEITASAQPLLVSQQLSPVPVGARCTAHVVVRTEGSPAAGAGISLIFVPLPVPSFSGGAANVMPLRHEVLATQITDGEGRATFDLPIPVTFDRRGYLVLEGPVALMPSDRLAIVIDPLLQE